MLEGSTFGDDAAQAEASLTASLVQEFRSSLAARDIDAVIDRWLLAGDALHVSAEDVTYLTEALSAAFNVPAEGIHLRITGSAKLGFSIVE